jgi:hypothetical protein
VLQEAASQGLQGLEQVLLELARRAVPQLESGAVAPDLFQEPAQVKSLLIILGH